MRNRSAIQWFYSIGVKSNIIMPLKSVIDLGYFHIYT
jgi:hypothetical protein